MGVSISAARTGGGATVADSTNSFGRVAPSSLLAGSLGEVAPQCTALPTAARLEKESQGVITDKRDRRARMAGVE